MYRQLFIKEFMGTKFRFLCLMTVMLLTFTLLAIAITMAETQNGSGEIPDISLSGKSNSLEIQHEMYTDIKPLYELFAAMNEGKVFNLYPVVTRAATSIQLTSLREATIYVEGFDKGYMNTYLINTLVEGRLPKDDTEIIVGSYFKKYFDISIGDAIGTKSLSLPNNQGKNVLVNLSLDENQSDSKDYKVVGVVSNNNLNFSVVRLNENKINPNRLLIYFTGENAEEKYKEVSEVARETGISSMIGSVEENHGIKKNLTRNLILTITMTSMIFLAVLVLTLLYVLKGTNRKIGILKALGIKDSMVIRVFANGFAIVSLSMLVLSIGITNIIYGLLNQQINNTYGFAMNQFKYSWKIFIAQIFFTGISYLVIVIAIKIRTSRVSPKECITKN